MTGPRLTSVVISDFRSIRGSKCIPLDGPIVLIHGPNGTGKTSILSAIELAATGNIEALQRSDPQYRRHLHHHDANRAEVTLTVSGLLGSGGTARVVSSAGNLEGRPLLDVAMRSFFTERCYLAQATLGRLLELYQNAPSRGISPLTQFVKDLLGLDHLDALIEGLKATGNIQSLRRIAPAYSDAEASALVAAGRVTDLETRLQDYISRASSLRDRLVDLLRALTPDAPSIDHTEALLATDLEAHELTRLVGIRQDLTTLHEQSMFSAANGGVAEIQLVESEELRIRSELEGWWQRTGSRLDRIIDGLRTTFPDLPSLASTDPNHASGITAQRVANELLRCEAALAQEEKEIAHLHELQQGSDHLRARRVLLEESFGGLSSNAGSLAEALAALLPHIHDDACPVCARDFHEISDTSLVERVTSHIAHLSKQAEQLRAVSKGLLDLQSAITQTEREWSLSQSKILTQEARTTLKWRVATLTEAQRQLAEVVSHAQVGSDLMRQQAELRGKLGQLRMRDAQGAGLRGRLDVLCESLSLPPLEAVEPSNSAIERLNKHLGIREADLLARQQLRRQALEIYRELASLENSIRQARSKLMTAREEHMSIRGRLAVAQRHRSGAKAIARAALEARTTIARNVLNDRLNRIWRDLFVRLAPSEPYVPSFRLPASDREPISAQVDTVLRNGDRGGAPGAMLSAGNLNTAALTLFLALHLSITPTLPWLLLDDPVQSMDEMHISQFAALLRTLSKGMDRQIVLAVHDRALFEYLALELSPAFPGDSLITVELSRSYDETTEIDPNILHWTEDTALAA